MALYLRKYPQFLYKFESYLRKPAVDCDTFQLLQCRHMISQKLVYSEYGNATDVIRREEESLPVPKQNQVVIRMLASPVNPADINTIQGVYPIKPNLPAIGGNEGVGEIESVGSDVAELTKGDWVMPKGVSWGTWRSHAVCDAKELIKIPNQIGLAEAATLSVNPCTSYRMLKDFVSLQPGDTIIQNGANSAVGQNVIQMCKAWGINSINIVRNRDTINELKTFLSELGATHVITEEEVRTMDLFKKAILPKPRLAMNCVGGKNALEMLRHLDQRGVMVTYGGMSRQPVNIPTSALIFKDIRLYGFWMTRWTTVNENNVDRVEMLDEIVQMILSGNLKPPVHKMVPFTNFKEALTKTLNPTGFSGKKYILKFQTKPVSNEGDNVREKSDNKQNKIGVLDNKGAQQGVVTAAAKPEPESGLGSGLKQQWRWPWQWPHPWPEQWPWPWRWRFPGRWRWPWRKPWRY